MRCAETDVVHANVLTVRLDPFHEYHESTTALLADD